MGGLTCRAEGIVEHDVAEPSQGIVGGLWDEDPFSCGETTGFEDEGVGGGLDVSSGVGEVFCGESGIGGGGDIVACHEVLCKGL